MFYIPKVFANRSFTITAFVILDMFKNSLHSVMLVNAILKFEIPFAIIVIVAVFMSFFYTLFA